MSLISSSLKGQIKACSGSTNMTLQLCSAPTSLGGCTLRNSSGDPRQPLRNTVLNDIFLGLLLTKYALMIDCYPTQRVPKSKLLVWFALSSTMYLAQSSAVACMSMASFIRMLSDLSLITPLNTPASAALNLTLMAAYCWGLILRSLGSTVRRVPWSWVNYMVPAALPLFLTAMVSSCSLPTRRKPKLTKGQKSIWLSVWQTRTGSSTAKPSSHTTLTIYVSFFRALHSYFIRAVVDRPGAISACIVQTTLRLGFAIGQNLMRLAFDVRLRISIVISQYWFTSMSLNTTSDGMISKGVFTFYTLRIQCVTYTLLYLIFPMLRQKFIGKSNRILTAPQPQLFQGLTLDQVQPYPLPSIKLRVHSPTDPYLLYHSPSPCSAKPQPLISLTTSPKTLILSLASQVLILQATPNYSLHQYLLRPQNHYLSQSQIRSILADTLTSLLDYSKNGLTYECLHPQNIVYTTKWELSLPAFILNTHHRNPDYYNSSLPPLNVLLWHLLFNAPPRAPSFDPHNYLTTNAPLLEVYYYFSRYLAVSPQCWSLVQCEQPSLDHPFFKQPLPDYHNTVQSNIQALSHFHQHHPQHNSLLLAAIEYKEQYPNDPIQSKPYPSATLAYALHYMSTHTLLTFIAVPQTVVAMDSKVEEIDIQIPYFGRAFDRINDYPCRDLMKGESINMLHGYPYAVMFELYKVVNEQPKQIQEVIEKTGWQLLEISGLYGNQLHTTVPTIKKFQEIKVSFRRNVHKLYGHFLEVAMRKYNTKWVDQNMDEGLEYYRLCLKLMEVSVVVRKKGLNLDLRRIETADRSIIQQDLNLLLQTYFCNKLQL